MSSNSTPKDPEAEIEDLSIPDLLNILGLHAPVQAGAIKGRVQRRLDALPPSRTYDRGVLKAIERRLMDYMRDNNLVTIFLNEENEDYTAIQDTGAQVSQDPTRFYGQMSYPQTVVAGDINPIDRRVMTKTLVVDSSFRKQYIAGDGILACAPLGCAADADACCATTTPSNSIPSCFQAPVASNCSLSNVGPGPGTNFALWHGESEQKYIEAFRNQYLNCLPNAGEGVVLPCKMFEEPAANFHFDLQRSTVKVISMELTSIHLPAHAVLTVPTANPDEYISGPGQHNLQCVYPSPDQLQTISQLDPRSTIWIVDEHNDYCIHPLSIPAGYYPDSFSIAQAITTAWQRLCQLEDPATTTCSLIGLEGAFRADGVRSAYVYDPANQTAPYAISPAHTNGHIALSFPTEPLQDETFPGRFSVWFVPPPQTPDGYLDVQARGTVVDDCPSHPCVDTDICPPSNEYSSSTISNFTNPDTGVTDFVIPSFRGVPPTGGDPLVPPVVRGQKPPVYKALPGSLGWILGFRVAQLSSADFAPAPQPNPNFYPQLNPAVPVFPEPGTARSVLIGSAPFQPSPHYLFLRINDHNNNYYAAVEGISAESVMPPDTLAVLELQQRTNLKVAPVPTQANPPVQQHAESFYTLSPKVPYKRVYFGPVDVARVRAVLLDSNRNVCDLGQNNYSFTLTFETLYNL